MLSHHLHPVQMKMSAATTEKLKLMLMMKMMKERQLLGAGSEIASARKSASESSETEGASTTGVDNPLPTAPALKMSRKLTTVRSVIDRLTAAPVSRIQTRA